MILISTGSYISYVPEVTEVTFTSLTTLITLTRSDYILFIIPLFLFGSPLHHFRFHF